MDRLGNACFIFACGMGLSVLIPSIPMVVCLVIAGLYLIWPIFTYRRAPKIREEDVPTDIIYAPRSDFDDVPTAGTFARAVENGTSPTLDGRGRVRRDTV